MASSLSPAPSFQIQPGVQGVRIELKGNWTKGMTLPLLPEHVDGIEWVDGGITQFDTTLAAWIQAAERSALPPNKVAIRANLPKRLHAWLELSTEEKGVNDTSPTLTLAETVGRWAEDSKDSWQRSIAHIGETVWGFLRLITGRARINWAEFPGLVRTAGPDALPITLLLGFLTGVIMAYVGFVQLNKVGAGIYVANLVGLAMTREMGALMTGVVACGRTSTAYASHLGSMNVTQETDALRVLGIQPVEYLAVPRVLAVLLVLPILSLFATLAGILGGMSVACGSGMAVEQYVNQVIDAVSVNSFLVGQFKAITFSVIVAWTGCYRGHVATPNARGVGQAATTAAVLGITLLVVSDAVFAVIFNLFNFS